MMRILLALLALAFAIPATAQPTSRPHVAWAKNANIYEVNIRQFTPEGTITAFEKHLPRLKKMGVKILWIMPVQPIGVKNRKGTMGSYYSIRDYTAINPEFGTIADFKRMVRSAQGMGFKVILDWVANHTAWDHPWITQHPEWYKRDAKGEIVSYNFFNGRETEYWTDVVGLDYKQAALWPAMIDAMKFWVREVGIDGFRCDVAMLVPEPFWAQVRKELDAIKPVFMLAEAAEPELHARAFDATYHWKLQELLVEIAKGKKTGDDLRRFYASPDPTFAPDAWRMNFTSNHDVNSWHGNDAENFGAGFEPFAVLAATLPGIPLVYGGQEGQLDKRIAFFEKDAIDWKGYKRAALYTKLLTMKTRHPALWNGTAGGRLTFAETGTPHVVAFTRIRGKSKIFVVANLSDKARVTSFGALDPWAWSITED
jgi:Alpha amylase, catalytic domain